MTVDFVDSVEKHLLTLWRHFDDGTRPCIAWRMLFSCLGPGLAKEMCGRLDGCCRQLLHRCHKWSEVTWLHEQAAWKSWRDINSLFLNPAQLENPQVAAKKPNRSQSLQTWSGRVANDAPCVQGKKSKSNGKVETKDPTDLQRWLQLRNYAYGQHSIALQVRSALVCVSHKRLPMQSAHLLNEPGVELLPPGHVFTIYICRPEIGVCNAVCSTLWYIHLT